jgi:hypothetical protein
MLAATGELVRGRGLIALKLVFPELDDLQSTPNRNFITRGQVDPCLSAQWHGTDPRLRTKFWQCWRADTEFRSLRLVSSFNASYGNLF